MVLEVVASFNSLVVWGLATSRVCNTSAKRRYGMHYRKRTVIFVNGTFLDKLGKLCKCTRDHVILFGWKSLTKPKTMMSTCKSGEYPTALCREWAKLVVNYLNRG